MPKRKEDEPKKGAPEWQTTFSDLMNLLLCFFVMLFSMSNVDEAKYNELVASMSSAFSIFDAGATAIGDGFLISNGVSQLNELDEYINSTGKTADSEADGDEFDEHDKGNQGANQGANGNEQGANGTAQDENQGDTGDDGKQDAEAMAEALAEQNLKNNELLAELVQEAVDEGNMSDQIEVSFNSQYVQLSMKGALLFDSGHAEVKEASKKVLDRVGVILERYGENTTIEIEGHTDNVPINSARFADNEELSSARALSVFYYLLDNTSLDPVRLKHAGMGERVPIADNSTAEGRSKNRRVEIRIYNPS